MTKKRRKSKASGYRKVWFSRGSQTTAGLILPSEEVEAKGVSGISRLFPISEAGKMAKLHVSPEFGTWDEAFKYEKKS